MPSRAPRSDCRVPRGFPRLRSFPEGEVAGAIFLILVDIDASTVIHAGKIFFRKLAVVGKLGDPEIIRAIFGTIGETFFHQFGNNSSMGVMVLGGAAEIGFLNV